MIKIYTTQNCVCCKTVKKYYDSRDIKYTEVDLTNDLKKHNELAKKYKTLSVPLIVNDEQEFTTGFNIVRLNRIAKTDRQMP